MNESEDTAIKFAPPVPVTGADGNEYFLRQSYAVVSPQESLNIAKAVVGLIAGGLAAAIGYQLTPLPPAPVNTETSPS